MSVISNKPIQCTIALAALEAVKDPEIGLNIVDLGLIRQIDFDETERKVYLTMTLTTSFCPMGNAITSAAGKVLEQTFSGVEAVVNLSFDPPWTANAMSAQGREFLNR